MSRRSLKRISAPGLPPWPRLYFDQDKKIAVVSARHATWRSFEWARRASYVLLAAATAVVAYLLWIRLPIQDPAIRGAGAFLITAFVFPIAKPLVENASRGFLARQIFASRTILWASEKAIAFKSRFYSKPVVVWRYWKGQTVTGKFILNRDLNATRYATDERQNKPGPRSHLDEAMVLEIVISAMDKDVPMTSRGQGPLQRTVPVTELNSQLATKFTMVFAAATMLTQKTDEKQKQSGSGTDIDA